MPKRKNSELADAAGIAALAAPREELGDFYFDFRPSLADFKPI